MGGPGNQNVFWSYYDPLVSTEFDSRNTHVIPVGVYYGGKLSIGSAGVAVVSPFIIEITDGTYQVAIKSSENHNVAVSSLNPFIVIRWAYSPSVDNYASILAVSEDNIEANDLILGRCLFTGGNLSGFDYSRRSIPQIHSVKVLPTPVYSNKVVVTGGWVEINGIPKRVAWTELTVSFPSSGSRTDVVAIKEDGSVVILQGVDIVNFSSLGLYLPLAILRLKAGQTVVVPKDIEDIRPFVSRYNVMVNGYSAYRNLYEGVVVSVVGDSSNKCKLRVFGGFCVGLRNGAFSPFVANLSDDIIVDMTTYGLNGRAYSGSLEDGWHSLDLVSNGSDVKAVGAKGGYSFPGYDYTRTIGYFYVATDGSNKVILPYIQNGLNVRYLDYEFSKFSSVSRRVFFNKDDISKRVYKEVAWSSCGFCGPHVLQGGSDRTIFFTSLYIRSILSHSSGCDAILRVCSPWENTDISGEFDEDDESLGLNLNSFTKKTPGMVVNSTVLEGTNGAVNVNDFEFPTPYEFTSNSNLFKFYLNKYKSITFDPVNVSFVFNGYLLRLPK